MIKLSKKLIREDSTAYIVNNQRRIDITLNFENKFEIGIENKPWDKEQENQLQDYEKHLRKKVREEVALTKLYEKNEMLNYFKEILI